MRLRNGRCESVFLAPFGDPGPSLSEKSEMVGGEGFWLCARRTVPRIPKAGCKERANEAHGQKHRRRLVPIFQTDS
jgi:hypothetical protein